MDYKNPVHRAAFEDQTGSLRFLIRQGLDLNEQCAGGDTPLHAAIRGAAARGERSEAFDMLHREGADDRIKNDAGLTCDELLVKLQEAPRSERVAAKMREFVPPVLAM